MTQAAAGVPQAHRFHGWEIRPHERVLLVDGVPAKLGGRAFDLLLALVERQGRVAGKDELLAAAWPGLVVEENNLSVQITALRRLLGSEAIVNVSGRGYRLVAAAPGPDGPTNVAAAPSTLAAAAPAPLAAPELVGREAELQDLLPLLGSVPLLSVVGTGGVGKTSLARAALGRLPQRPRDGVHWIDLAPLRPGTPLMPRVARSLGVLPQDFAPASEDLILSLSQLHTLVVLDNCEHLLADVAALLGPLLQRAPGIRWLATSQEPLRLGGEAVYRLGPLDVPEAGAELSQAVGCGALALFCRRAQAADHRFELGAEELPLAIELCRQLDGLPLALEMAAARVASLGLRGVHDQIAQRLRLQAGTRDAPARHHTLLQTIEWSHGLLSDVEQQVFRRLEPFVGGFTPALALQLCAGVAGSAPPLQDWQVLDALSALVDKSLVQRQLPGEAARGQRLWLLESARDYARLRLDEAGETGAVRQAHAEALARWFASAGTELQQMRDADWAARYRPERRNVCAALAWACSNAAPDLLATLVAALAQLDTFAQTQAEVVRYPVPLAQLRQAAPALRARALLEFGWAHFLDGSRELGTELALGALSDFEALGDVAGAYLTRVRLIRLYRGRRGLQEQAEAMWNALQQVDEAAVPLRYRLECASTVAFRFGQPRTVERLRQLHQVAAQAGFDALAGSCGGNVTDVLLVQGRFDDVVGEAAAVLREGLPGLRAQGMVQHNLALALVRLGRLDEARQAARAMLRALPNQAHMLLDLFALAAVDGGRHEEAALMAGLSARIKRERDRYPEPAEAAVIHDTLARLDAALGPERRAEMMRLGESMSAAELVALALPA